MSALYLYAITECTAEPVPALTGLGEAPIETLCYGDLLAIFSRIDPDQSEWTRARLLQHEVVIEALMANRSVLPARYGTLAPSEQQLREVLRLKYEAYRANLNYVRGRVELALRVLGDGDMLQLEQPPQQLEVQSGRQYLLGRLAAQQQENRQRAMIAERMAELTLPIRQLAAEHVQQILPRPRMLLVAAYLVDQQQLPQFRQQVKAVQAAHPQVALVASGPWPAYSFVKA